MVTHRMCVVDPLWPLPGDGDTDVGPPQHIMCDFMIFTRKNRVLLGDPKLNTGTQKETD